MPTIVGVFREAEYSPGKVEDDAAILDRTAAALRTLLGRPVDRLKPEEAPTHAAELLLAIS